MIELFFIFSLRCSTDLEMLVISVFSFLAPTKGKKMCKQFFNKDPLQTCHDSNCPHHHDPTLLHPTHWWHHRSTTSTARESICGACNGPEQCCVQASCDRLKALLAYAKYMPTVNTLSTMYQSPTAPSFSSSLSVQARSNTAAAIKRIQRKEARDGQA